MGILHLCNAKPVSLYSKSVLLSKSFRHHQNAWRFNENDKFPNAVAKMRSDCTIKPAKKQNNKSKENRKIK